MRTTRSASRKARLIEAVATGPLGALSHDELGVIFDGLADPLWPVLAVAFSSTCLGLRTPLRAALEVLRQRHEKAKALCDKGAINDWFHRRVRLWSDLDARRRWALDNLRYTKTLFLNADPQRLILNADDMATLSMIIATNGLPSLQKLHVNEISLDVAGMHVLCEGLGHGLSLIHI